MTLLPGEPDPERDAMLRLAAQGLARAYGDNEPEYTLADLKEINPLYEGRP